jgi:hypothetical protein
MQTNQAKDLKALLERLEAPHFVLPPKHEITEVTTKQFYIKDPDDKEGWTLLKEPREMFLRKIQETAVLMCSEKDEARYQVKFFFNLKEIGNFLITTEIKKHEHWVQFTNNYNGKSSIFFRGPGDGLVGSRSSVFGFGVEMSNWFNINYCSNIDEYNKRLNRK